MIVRAQVGEIDQLIILIKHHWPEFDEEKLKRILFKYLSDVDTLIMINKEGELINAIALASIRYNFVYGCNFSPVGYLDGLYVEPDYRFKHLGRNLVSSCEAWAKEKGCKEFASDTDFENYGATNFHINLGFDEVNRIIHFKKNL